ncbi:MAG TPA: nickel/cobalt transporter [Hyphomicrobiaceae bacterium]|nr:nickel/cobalt transporter [Hyphomicrobiaceae bacterium]
MKIVTLGRGAAAFGAAGLLALVLSSEVAAQLASTPPVAKPGGIWATILSAQQDVQTALGRALERIKTTEPLKATAFLALLSFVYGVLHAVGPGHGKAVISSYVLANERTMRRGIVLSFLSAFAQAIVAILLVVVLRLVLRLTQLETRLIEPWLDVISWGLVAAVGAWLLWREVRRMLRVRAARGVGEHAHDHHAHSHHAHSHHDHAHHHDHTHPAAHGRIPHGAPGHVHDEHCGHAHMPGPEALEGEWSWRRAFPIILAVGLRPCTGAIVVLVAASGLGLFWAGVISTFVMSLGTAITVSALAALAVGSRELAIRLFGGDGRRIGALRSIATIAGAVTLLAFGTLFLLASLTTGSRAF